jgi:CRP/FNR family transcriptional regulator
MDPIPLPDRLDTLLHQHCSPEWRKLLEQRTKVQQFAAGEDIFKEKQKADILYIMRHGKAKVYSTFEPGSSRILRFARDGQVLGHRGIGMDFTYTVTATALSDCVLEMIPMPLFLEVMRANAAFTFHFMLFMAEELRRSEQQVKNLMNMSVLQRVAKALQATAECFGYDPDDRSLLAFTPSRQDLADYAGTTYESTIRAIGELQKKKLIKTMGREIRIMDRRKLDAAIRG